MYWLSAIYSVHTFSSSTLATPPTSMNSIFVLSPHVLRIDWWRLRVVPLNMDCWPVTSNTGQLMSSHITRIITRTHVQLRHKPILNALSRTRVSTARVLEYSTTVNLGLNNVFNCHYRFPMNCTRQQHSCTYCIIHVYSVRTNIKLWSQDIQNDDHLVIFLCYLFMWMMFTLSGQRIVWSKNAYCWMVNRVSFEKVNYTSHYTWNRVLELLLNVYYY